jgi:23S rRNA (guanosine2251-2'-O)-methyltransferase
MKDEVWIWGHHAIEACFDTHPELLLEILSERDPGQIARSPDPADLLLRRLKDEGQRVTQARALPRDLADKRTQGLAARLKRFPYARLSDVKELRKQPGVRQWALLDGVEDPRNFGALLRSAAAFGLSGVFVASRNQSPVTGVVAQAAAGQCFRVPVVLCGNLKEVWTAFEDGPFAVFATLDAGGEDLSSRVAHLKADDWVWVIGSEGEGVRPSLKDKCEAIVRIPMAPGVESLNVSVASSIAFYAVRQGTSKIEANH